MFLEKVYSGRNQWYFYIFSLLIIFTATQIGSLPLVGYMIMEDPSILQGGDISAATSTNTGLALTLLSFAVGFFTILFCVKYIHHKKTANIVTGRQRIDWGRIFFRCCCLGYFIPDHPGPPFPFRGYLPSGISIRTGSFPDSGRYLATPFSFSDLF